MQNTQNIDFYFNPRSERMTMIRFVERIERETRPSSLVKGAMTYRENKVKVLQYHCGQHGWIDVPTVTEEPDLKKLAGG